MVTELIEIRDYQANGLPEIFQILGSNLLLAVINNNKQSLTNLKAKGLNIAIEAKPGKGVDSGRTYNIHLMTGNGNRQRWLEAVVQNGKIVKVSDKKEVTITGVRRWDKITVGSWQVYQPPKRQTHHLLRASQEADSKEQTEMGDRTDIDFLESNYLTMEKNDQRVGIVASDGKISYYHTSIDREGSSDHVEDRKASNRESLLLKEMVETNLGLEDPSLPDLIEL